MRDAIVATKIATNPSKPHHLGSQISSRGPSLRPGTLPSLLCNIIPRFVFGVSKAHLLRDRQAALWEPGESEIPLSANFQGFGVDGPVGDDLARFRPEGEL